MDTCSLNIGRRGNATRELSGAPLLLLLQCENSAQRRNLAYPNVSKHSSLASARMWSAEHLVSNKSKCCLFGALCYLVF